MYIWTRSTGEVQVRVNLSSLGRMQRGCQRVFGTNEAAVNIAYKFAKIAKERMLQVYDSTMGRGHQERNTGTLRRILAMGPRVEPLKRGALISLVNEDLISSLGSPQGGVLHPGFQYFWTQESGHRAFNDFQPFRKIFSKVGPRGFGLQSVNKINAPKYKNIFWLKVRHPMWKGRRFVQAGKEAWALYKNNKSYLYEIAQELKNSI